MTTGLEAQIATAKNPPIVPMTAPFGA
jgi:hypothetical protein